MTQEKILRGPAVKTPIPRKTLGQLLFECAVKNGEKLCQVDGTTDETETYASVRLRSTRVALELLKRGITHNDVITFCLKSTIDTVIPILGTFYVGAKVANLDPSLSVRQTVHLISLTFPKIIFVEADSVDLIEQSLQQANQKAEIIVHGQSDKYVTFQQLTQPAEGEETFKPVAVDIHEVALMFFSSGTTGLPKALCHSHYSAICMGYSLVDMDMGNVVVHFTGFYWITAVLMLLQSQLTGGCRLFGRSFNAETVFRIIEKYKVTTIFMAPILTYQLTNFKDAHKYDLSSVKQVHCGGTPISTIQFQELVKLFKDSNVLGVYGMSEVGYSSSFDPKTDQKLIKTKIKSVGKPVPGLALKIVNPESGEILGANQNGEIRVKTESLMTGYYNADSSDALDEAGFLKTGDIGYYDEDGCLYVVERMKEMFKYQSWHVVPSAVEAVLLDHPAVKEAVVFGVPCGVDGEAPAACIILERGKRASKEEIFDWVTKNASDREKLRGGIWFVDSLPKTPTGKVIRKQVRSCYVKDECYVF